MGPVGGHGAWTVMAINRISFAERLLSVSVLHTFAPQCEYLDESPKTRKLKVPIFALLRKNVAHAMEMWPHPQQGNICTITCVVVFVLAVCRSIASLRIASAVMFNTIVLCDVPSAQPDNLCFSHL